MYEYRIVAGGWTLTEWESAPGLELPYDNVVFAPITVRRELDVTVAGVNVTDYIRVEFRKVLLNANESQEALTDRASDKRGPDSLPDA